MRKRIARTPRYYEGTIPPIHHASALSLSVLGDIQEMYQERPDLIMGAWPEVIGPQLAPMTRALSFQEGILIVLVKNSTLHSLLSQRDRVKILASLRQKFPKVAIKSIVFRIG
ncbi:MAG: DUF721 domain-containing protein [Parachlamydiaceae bacterium]|nr:DUF721 domain-containing protein [Parachlamydiaceae bacterium]